MHSFLSLLSLSKTMGMIKKLIMTTLTLSTLLLLLLLPSILPSSILHSTNHHTNQSNPRYPVSFAYLISASAGDVDRLTRTLAAVYHPANCYLLHLDREAPPEEHARLAEAVSLHPAYAQTGNVWIVRRPNLVTYRGPTMLSTTLHAISILLRVCRWDWFINLSASDYPLITQDDLIAAFASLPRDLNFVEHTSRLGWKIKKRARPIVVDPALHGLNKTELLWSAHRRSLPTAFKLFTGSAWTVLSRPFAEYCIVGWDNLPRTLLLYYTNFISSPEGYFQTLICNSRRFRNTTVNHDLHYITWDNPPRQHPLSLGLKDYRRMILSGAAFARKFERGGAVLDRIDRELLRRKDGRQFARGGWCYDEKTKTCSGERRTPGALLRPGAGSRRLKALLAKLRSARNFSKRQ